MEPSLHGSEQKLSVLGSLPRSRDIVKYPSHLGSGKIRVEPGWVEHDADEIWASQMGVAVEAMNMIGVSAEGIAHLTLVPAKYASITSPVFSLNLSVNPFSFRESQYSDVLLHCHTIA